MKTIVTVEEKTVYHHKLIIEPENKEQLEKIIRNIKGNASDLYEVMDILLENGVKIVEKIEIDDPWIEAAEILDVSEISDENNPSSSLAG